MCYPYLHLTTDEFVVKQRLKDALKFQDELPENITAKIDQGRRRPQSSPMIRCAEKSTFLYAYPVFAGCIIIASSNNSIVVINQLK